MRRFDGYTPRVRLLRRLVVMAVLAAVAFAAPLRADDALDLKVRTGAAFSGRVVGSDESFLRLKGADGAEIRLAWKDLDERSWLAAKRAVTPQDDAKGLLVLGKFAAEKGFRLDAEALLDRVRKLDATLAPDCDALRPRIAALRAVDAQALFDKGQAEIKRERYQHALGRFREARDLSPRDARFVTAVGEAQYYLRRLKESRASMLEALALDPVQKDALIDLAQLDLLELDFAASLKGVEKLLLLPVAEGKVATREEVLAKAKETKATDLQEAFEKLADIPLLQAKDLAPVLRGVVAGPGFATEFRAQTDHYDVRTGVSQEVADLLAGRLELIWAEYDRRFGYGKTGETKSRGKGVRFPVLVFADRKGYVEWFGRVLSDPQFGAMTGGVYVPLVKHLVFFQYEKFEDTQLVAWHEGFHQYLDYFVANAPHWFNEGSAEYFGGSVLPPGKKRVEVGQTNRWRAPPLAQIVAQKRIPDARWFMQTSAATYMRLKPEPEQGKNGATTVGDHYALGWALVHFLQEGQGGKWSAKYVDYFKTLCDGVSHAEAFDEIWGKTNWPKFQAAWEAHCAWLAARADAEANGKPVPPMPK
jgi:tetratricopeptide (TPR) repeat protein